MVNAGTFKISYNVDMIRIDNRTREVKSRRRFHNVLTAVGLRKLTELIMDGFTDASFSKIAIGLGSTTATSSDTALETENQSANAVMEYQDDYKAVFTYEFTFNETTAIWECGVFDVYGNMLNHGVDSQAQVCDQNTNLSVEIIFTVAPDV